MRDNAMKRTNRIVLAINWLINIFLAAGYIMEYLKGGRSLLFICIYIPIILVAVGTATLIYYKKSDSHVIKYVTIIGFFAAYSLAMFTSPKIILFVFVFPIIISYFLYYDLRFMVQSCIMIFIINAAKIAYQWMYLGLNDSGYTTDYTIQIAFVLTFSFSMIVSTKLSNQFSREKVGNIEEEKSKQEAILKDVLGIASVLDQNSKRVFDIIGELVASTSTVTAAVDDIAKGAADIARSIQSQSHLTQNIHSVIEAASDLSKHMGSTSVETTTAVGEGFDIVRKLDEKSQSVNECNNNVYSTMFELGEKTREIEHIVTVIAGISEQTNLLSLNAAIESARAGEAGKGFAVVADEIRKLSTQTKDSTEEIKKIVGDFQQRANGSIEAAQKLKDTNTEQNELIHQTSKIFSDIMARVKEVNSNIELVNNKVNEILYSNNKLVEDIGEITAFSEQSTANAHQASEMTNLNIEQANLAKKLAEELIETSKLMDKYLEK